MTVRLVDAGTVSALRSQTVYHSVAYAFSKDSPNTIILVSPESPYVCIGFHQEIKKEVDVNFCVGNNIPIVRREVGGGAVYLDNRQLFTQWIFHANAYPMRIGERFKMHAYPIIETYKALGIDAFFRPVNDVQVHPGKKIGGMGAAAIGNAEVLVCSFMFDFDFELMSKVLNVPDEKFRDKIYQSLNEYMTTMKKELGTLPSRETVKQLYIEKCEEVLGDKIEEGEFSKAELQKMNELDSKFSSDAWLFSKGSHARPAVKIHSGVWVGEASVKTPGGLINATIRLRNNCIDDITLSGDFTFYPHTKFAKMEKALLHAEATPEKLSEIINRFYNEEKIQSPGVEPHNWVDSIVELAESVKRN